MTPEVLRALHGTVDRWLGISEGKLFDGGFDGCPLCSLMDPVRNGCGACPVRHSTGQDGCHGTPYWDFEHSSSRTAAIPSTSILTGGPYRAGQ